MLGLQNCGKGLDAFVAFSERLRWIARPDAQQRMHAGRVRRVEFSNHVRSEKYLAGSQAEHLSDHSIALQILLRANGRIEIIVDEGSEIASLSVSKKKLLRQRAAGRKYVDA